MKIAPFVIVAAMSVSVAASAQTAGSSSKPTNSPGVTSPDKRDSQLGPGGVIDTQTTGKSAANTGPVSLATPTRPLVSGPNPPVLPPSGTGAATAGHSGPNQ